MTKSKIMEATIKNFSVYGYQGTTMRKIAEEADIKASSIYYFFSNKQELFIEVIRYILDHHFTSMKSVFEINKSEQLHTLFSELLKGIVSHHLKSERETKAYIMIVSSPIRDFKLEVQDYLDSYNTWLVDHLMENIGEKHPNLHKSEVKSIIDHFIFIGNGLFWGVVIYEEEEIEKNLELGISLMNQYLNQIL